MVVVVGTPPFRRIALLVAMETMHLHIARLSFFYEDNFLRMPRVTINNLTPMETCRGG